MSVSKVKTPRRKPSSLPPIPAAAPAGPTKYGHTFNKGDGDLDIELACFRKRLDTGHPPQYHFKKVVHMLWPAGVKGRLGFIWHPWADEMLDACIESDRVGFAGCASSGKSEFMAVWSLVNWLSAPRITLVLVTSTTIRDAKLRVWGAITKYFQAIPAPMWPAKLTNSPTPAILTKIGDVVMEKSGILLIPAEARKTNEVTGKMRGMKNKRVFLVADELSELSDALVDTALSNLDANPYFHMVAASNPNSYFDPFGKFVTPKDGWKSIHVDTGRWATINKGLCVHFDALKSPNWLARETIWPILPYEKIEAKLETMSQNSLLFWRDMRGFWAMEGCDDTIYTDSEIVKFEATRAAKFTGSYTKIAALDPSFTKGGDRTVLYLGSVGDEGQSQVLQFDRHILLEEDVTDLSESRSFQIAEKIKSILYTENVDIRNFGMDVTGAGLPFSEILARTMGSNRFLHVNFGGAASEDPVSTTDSMVSKDRYVNRVSELWFRGAELLRSGKLRGMSPELCRELSSRKYTTQKGASMKLMVEPKAIYKTRHGRSPDIADSAVVLVEVAFQRFHLKGSWRPTSHKSEWRSFWKKKDATSLSGRFLK